MPILREEAVAWVNSVYIRNLRRADDAINPQVGFATSRFTDADGFISHLDVHGVDICFRINRDGADVQFLAGTDDPNSDFTTICYENFLKHEG